MGLKPANMVVDNPVTLDDALRDARAAGVPPKGVAALEAAWVGSSRAVRAFLSNVVI